MKNYLYGIILGILILFAILMYNFTPLDKEFLGLVISPFTTLLIFLILEDHKVKWNSKYEAFKTLYANRGKIINDKTINCLNSIDILFIDDKKVRGCWKKLYETFNKGTEIKVLKTNAANEKHLQEILELENKNFNNMQIGLVELLMSMSIALGLNKDISYSNLSEFYDPAGFSERKAKDDAELNYYQTGAKFFQEYKP